MSAPVLKDVTLKWDAPSSDFNDFRVKVYSSYPSGQLFSLDVTGQTQVAFKIPDAKGIVATVQTLFRCTDGDKLSEESKINLT